MNHNHDSRSALPHMPLTLPGGETGLAAEVAARSKTNPQSCMSCLSCSGGCPFYRAMDLGPHRVMRYINYGLRQELMASNTIWLCVGCHTCSTVCPMAIDVAAVMDTLRQMALEEGAPVAQPDILAFHREVLETIEKYGRTHKLEIMLRFKARSGHWFQDFDLGLKMLAKRKLDLRPSKIKDPEEIKRLFSRSWRR